MKLRTGISLGVAVALALASGAHAEENKKPSAKKEADKKPTEAASDSMTLKGGEEGTIFKSLRIEGEDLVRVEFERPHLDPDVDPYGAAGLEWESFHSVLERSFVDLVSPYLKGSAVDQRPYNARPWLDAFASGDVVHFRPQLEGVTRWQLIVANSKGETVAILKGNGKPPKDLNWDARSQTGKPVPPGYTYSYVLEAFDEAGNKRNFVGEGFELPSYFVKTSDGVAFLFGGDEMVNKHPEVGGSEPPAAVLLEAASWINQSTTIGDQVRIEVTSRSRDEAARIAEDVSRKMASLLLGDPARIQTEASVASDAASHSLVVITLVSTRR